jgi:hypothetical protein
MSAVARPAAPAHQHAVVMSLGYGPAQGFHYGRAQTCADIVDTVTRETSRTTTTPITMGITGPDQSGKVNLLRSGVRFGSIA